MATTGAVLAVASELGALRVVGPLEGYHHETYAVLLDAGSMLGRRFRWLKLREPRPGIFWYDLRCFQLEEALLRFLQGSVPRIPQVAHVAGKVSALSFVEGVTLGTLNPAGKRIDDRHLDQIEEIFHSLAALDTSALRADLACDHAEHSVADNSDWFLDDLIAHTIRDVYEQHCARFGGIFDVLGINDDALWGLLRRQRSLNPRPYRLVHGDLHRENFIIDPGGDLWTIDWELARIGDPLYDLATHLHLMSYPKKQAAEVVRRWKRAVEKAQPGLSAGVDDDLKVYLAYKRMQSVYTDTIRGVTGLLGEVGSLGPYLRTARTLRRTLKRAQGPLGRKRTPFTVTIAVVLVWWCLKQNDVSVPSGRTQRHPVLRLLQWLESKLRVHPVRVVRGQQYEPDAQSLQAIADGRRQRRRQAAAAGGRDDVDVAEPGERGVVRDDAGAGDLGARRPVVRAEVEGGGDGRVLDGAGAAEGPVGVGGEPVVDQGGLHAGGVGGYLVPRLGDAASCSTAYRCDEGLLTGP